MGISIALLAMLQYRKTMHLIDTEQFKPSNAIVIFVGIMTAVFGAIMTIYLILASETI